MKQVGLLHICGFPYKLYLCAEGEPYTGIDENTDGMCHADKQLIAIKENRPKEQRLDTAFHEAEHALWFHSGVASYLQEKLGKSRSDYEEVEETCIQIMAPHRRLLIPQLAKLRLK